MFLSLECKTLHYITITPKISKEKYQQEIFQILLSFLSRLQKSVVGRTGEC